MDETKTKRTKKAAAEKGPKPTGSALPNVKDLRLAPGGLSKSDKNRYINVTFTNGYSVRLLPVGVPAKDVAGVRDLMIEWLTSRA